MSDIARRSFLKTGAAIAIGSVAFAGDEPSAGEPLVMVVMDPLAAPLACPCVKGYAQRDYEKLAKYLEAKVGRSVKVVFGESLANTLSKKSQGQADIIIGKDSVVRFETQELKMPVAALAALSGKDGKTTMTGLLVVAAKDTALEAADLKGYRILFGEASAAEKYSAPLAMFKELGVAVPTKLETCIACTDGATKVIDAAKKGEKVATVISSYAQPLLEGCGTIQKGDLRVIGETEPVPFIVAFANEKLPEAYRQKLQDALLNLRSDKELCTALETQAGFVSLAAKKK